MTEAKEIEEKLRILASPPKAQLRPERIGIEEMVPDKNYAKLALRLPYNLKVDFEKICAKIEKTPSAQARSLISQFVDENRDKIE